MRDILYRIRCDRRGLTLVEITIALLLLSIGLVSILALFPKALYSTQRVMEISTASGVARSAFAEILADAIDGNIDDSGSDSDLKWHADHNGDNGSDAYGWWPEPSPDDLRFGQSIKTLSANGDPDKTDIRVENIGNWQSDDSSPGWRNNIKNYFLLMTSGRGRGKLCEISGLNLNVSSSTDEVITVPAKLSDLIHQGVRVGDSFQIVGPGCVMPSTAAVAMDDASSTAMYSWLAVFCENGSRSLIDSGTASSVVGNWLTDDDKAWVKNQFSAAGSSVVIYISGGTGAPNWKPITGNTKKAVSVGGWGSSPGSGSSYQIYDESGGMHKVIILVYDEKYDPTGNLSQINACKPVYFFNGTVWEQ